MAEATSNQNVGLLYAAGVAKDAQSMTIERASHERDRVVPLLQQLGDAMPYLRGNKTYIPVISERTVQVYYDRTSSNTENTNIKGQDPTPTAESGAKVQMAERWEGSAHFMSKYDLNQLSPEERTAYMRAVALEDAAALAKSRGQAVLGLANPSYISSGNQMNASAPADLTPDDLGEIIERLLGLEVEGPYYGFVSYKQFSVLDAMGRDAVSRFSWPEGPGLLSQDLLFRRGNLTIIPTTLIYDDAVDGAWGMFFGAGSVKFSGLGVEVDEWYENKPSNYWAKADQAYKWALVKQEVVTIQTPR